MVNPFIAMVNQVLAQYKPEVKPAKDGKERLSDNILDTIWLDIDKTYKDEYDIFYPHLKIVLRNVLESDQRIRKIFLLMANYLINKMNQYNMTEGTEIDKLKIKRGKNE